MAYEEQDEATSLYISYMVYMIITQTRCAIASGDFRGKMPPLSPSTSGSRPREKKSRSRAEHKI